MSFNKLNQIRAAGLPALTALLCVSLTGCLMVGGSSRGGFFIWPGSFGLLIILVIIFALMRRR